MNKEPVALTGALTGIVNAVIAVLVGFTIVHWTPEQIALVVGLWNSIISLVFVFVIRNKVTPT